MSRQKLSSEINMAELLDSGLMDIIIQICHTKDKIMRQFVLSDNGNVILKDSGICICSIKNDGDNIYYILFNKCSIPVESIEELFKFISLKINRDNKLKLAKQKIRPVVEEAGLWLLEI